MMVKRGGIMFAPLGKYEPCGMFSIEHIISIIMCFISIFINWYSCCLFNKTNLLYKKSITK